MESTTVRLRREEADLEASRALAEGAMREGSSFWQDVWSWQLSIAPLIVWRVLGFGLYALLVSVGYRFIHWSPSPVHVVEVTGAVLALLLVLRSNAGYDRWWEARKLWGGIVNQSRNLALCGLAYGPKSSEWRETFVRWVAAFSHAARRSLRAEHKLPELNLLLDAEDVRRIESAAHMPSYVLLRVAQLLREAHDAGQLSDEGLHRAEQQRAMLLDHIGGCERILRTRFPLVHRSMLGQFTLVYLAAFPFMIVGKGMFALGRGAGLTMLVAYLLFALDQIARELGNPFSLRNRSHLPLDEITRGIQHSVLGLLLDGSDEVVQQPPAAAAR